MRAYSRTNVVLVFSLMMVFLIGLSSPASAAPRISYAQAESSIEVRTLLVTSAAALSAAITLFQQHRGSTPAQSQDIQRILAEMRDVHGELNRLQKMTGLAALAVLKVCNRMPPWASQLTSMGMLQVLAKTNEAYGACQQAYQVLQAANPSN